MQRKRKEESKNHLLKKIRKLEKKISKLPDSDDEVKDIEEGEVIESEQGIDQEDIDFVDVIDEFDNKENDLEDEVLNVLGVAPDPAPKKEILHKQIAERWCDILNKGLKKEEKESITKENPAFENVPKMLAPKLNKEVAAALYETAKRRDMGIENRQKQICTALACVGQALQMCVEKTEKDLTLIKKLNEAGRILCDSMFLENKSRRNFVLSSINKDLKDSLLETDTTDFLFGDNLIEKIKTAKAVQKSGKELKVTVDEKKKKPVGQVEFNTKNRTLNWRGPPRGGITQKFQRTGGPTSHRHQQPSRKMEDKIAHRRGRK